MKRHESKKRAKKCQGTGTKSNNLSVILCIRGNEQIFMMHPRPSEKKKIVRSRSPKVLIHSTIPVFLLALLAEKLDEMLSNYRRVGREVG